MPQSSRPVLASELYAKSQLASCSGPYECHWCGGPCNADWIHDDPPPVPFLKSRSGAKRPANPWICVGCYLFRRQRITVHHLRGSKHESKRFLDRQCPMDHSWFVVEQAAWSLDKGSVEPLYERLLKPPRKFFLSLLSNDHSRTFLHLSITNDLMEIQADTVLYFTLDNIPHSYTVYELERALRGNVEGCQPGVHALLRILGPHELPPLPEPVSKKERGRPAPHPITEQMKPVKRTVRASGQ